MQISFTFKRELATSIERLRDLVYEPNKLKKLSEDDIKFNLDAQKKFKMILDDISITVKELNIVLRYVEETNKKEYYEDVLYAVKKLLKFLNKNEQEWFDTEEYTLCSDGQDRRNKKYILWDEIYELAS